MSCRGCGTENRPGRRFCSECGAALDLPCPACGAANEPGDKFCGECGGPLLDSAPPPAATASVSERRLGDELNVRVGVLTGCAAVELGAEGEGMVLGDTVNTASRLQSIAAPGSVLVDDVTRSEEEAIELLRTVGARPLLAKALLERARRRDDTGALAEARSIYGELGATRWLERLDQTTGVPA